MGGMIRGAVRPVTETIRKEAPPQPVATATQSSESKAAEAKAATSRARRGRGRGMLLSSASLGGESSTLGTTGL
jgi:hypothetical protein